MPWTNEHLTWLRDTGEKIAISTGENVPVYEFAYEVANETIMSNWARHFRNHYCSDAEIAILKPEGMTNSEYLLNLKFPHKSEGFGPRIRSGDFAEILVADYLAFLNQYYVPRTRYDRKMIGNESPKGSDVLGFKQKNENPSSKDELIIYEVKARLSENNASNTLQTAIDDSSKDEARLAESLNGARQMEANKSVLVVCTSTLAQGVNLPIRYLVVSSTFQAGQEITTRDFHNLIGRAGRAGYHTEGSVIFADTDVFDKRINFRERWKWQRAMHLLDFTNAEDCASSLLGLISPFDFAELDVDVIQFITNPSGYRQSCIDAGNQNAIDISSLLDQMDYKEALIEAIESYFLSYLKDNPGAPQTFFDELAQGTLAYFLSDDDHKQQLRTAFSLIAARVLAVPEEKRSFFGRSLLGLKNLFLIENWLNQNWDQITQAHSSDELLVICWSLLSQLNDNKMFLKIKPEEVILEFAKLWISGSSYSDLYDYLAQSSAYYQAGSQQRAIKMDHVVDLADSAFSFDSMLYVGAIADVAEGKGLSNDVLELLRRLQTRLKLGLSNGLEIWLYSRGYVDREVCKKLALSLHNEGVDTEVFDFGILKVHKAVVHSVMADFPSYFSRESLKH